MKKIIKGMMLLLSLMFISNGAIASVSEPPARMTDESKECAECHKGKAGNAGLVQQWGDSKHYRCTRPAFPAFPL